MQHRRHGCRVVRVQLLSTSLLLLALAACSSPAPARAPTGAGAAPAPAQQAAPTRLSIGIGAEINNLATKLEGGNTFASEFNFMSNSPLVLLDSQGAPRPLLAAELPSRDNGTWTVNPDGTMTTLWKIRPNAKWHDGRPVVANDFLFSHRVTMDDAVPVRDREPERYMERLEAQDDKTVLIHWKQPYPWANQLVQHELEPLPEHIMGSLHASGDTEAFLNNPFWSSTAYVGTGPFTLVQWDPGTQLVYRAFNDYFMGRPKIDEVTFRVISDSNAVVANVLGGNVDVTLGVTLGQRAGVTVKSQWDLSGDGQVLVVPVRFRYTQIQLDANRTQQPALLDPRVRRAIAHGIDRSTLAEIVTEGTSTSTEIPLVPNDPIYPAADRAAAKYPYDQNRALALLQEAGWTRRGEALVNDSAQQFVLDIRTTAGSDNETEMSIMSADLSKLGMQISQTVAAQSRIRDNEYRVTFPGLNTTAQSIANPGILAVVTSDQCASNEKRFVGSNRGCWKNAEFDRLYATATQSLDPTERGQAVVSALKVLTEEVGILGLSYNSENLAIRKGLVGLGPRWSAQTGNTWNIHEWHWAQ